MIGVPDEKYGEELCAWVRMRDGREPLDADVGARLRRPAGSRTTRSRATCMVVDEFPMTVTGKVRKVEMREVSTARLGLA